MTTFFGVLIAAAVVALLFRLSWEDEDDNFDGRKGYGYGHDDDREVK